MMKLNLTGGLSIDSDDPRYVLPGPEGSECGALAPDAPYYRCTRRKGHEDMIADAYEGNSARDHAAHGGRRSSIVMYARWASLDGDGADRNGDGE